MKPRYVPKKHMCHKHGSQIMIGTKAVPPSARVPGDAPIVSEMTLLTVDLACGCRRFYGVEKAWITSRLRMAAQGGFINSKNELAKAWQIARDIEDEPI